MNGSVLRVLSLASIFPNPEDSLLGVFVKTRLEHVAALSEVKVFAPVPVLDYSATTARARWRGLRLGASEYAGSMEILHPRWLYPPGGCFLNSFCLSVCLVCSTGRLKRRYPFDILDAHFGYPDGIAAALLSRWFGRPFCVTLRGSELYHSRSTMLRYWMGWSLRRAIRVIVQSDELGALAVSLGVNPSRVKKIPNGLDSSIYYAREREVCRVKHRLNAGNRFILSVGHLRALKGHQFTIRAFQALHRRNEVNELLIAGDGGTGAPSYEPELRRLAAELGVENHVRFMGRISPGHVAELMSAADVFCLASTREGCPNVVQEALACGCPVVSTGVGGVADMVPSSRYGIIVAPNDAAALEQGLRRALATEWDRAAISAWGQARSWREVARDVVAELQHATTEYAAGARDDSTQRLPGVQP